MTFTSFISTQAQEQFTGTLNSGGPSENRYPVDLIEGQIISAKTEATSGDLDTILRLESPSGEIIQENDDIDNTTRNSAIRNIVAQTDGTYTVVIANVNNTGGDYVMTIIVTDPPDAQLDDVMDETYTGYMSDTQPDDRYEVTLEPGEAIIALATASARGSLDTYLFLEDENGDVVAENDDRRYNDYDSELVYVSENGGDYTLILTNYVDTEGDYNLRIRVAPADEAPLVIRVEFSGPALYYDTPHFRIHYTLRGTDATTEAYVERIAEIMEDVLHIQITEFGWSLPPSDGIVGGDDRFDVYLIDLINEDTGGDYGVAVVEPPIMDDDTTTEEESSAAAYILLDNDYIYYETNPDQLMQATAAHEFHHAVQFGYDALEDHNWYLEATSTWMETQTFPEAQDATGYVVDVFTYPEVCFGADGDADLANGLLKYGYWLFMQSLVDAYGFDVVQELWQNISHEDMWAPLETTLDAYGDTLPRAVARYHVQNLVRDYELTAQFSEDTVWQENVINDEGRWTFRGEGIQELGANYYALNLDAGRYEVKASADDGQIELWMVGIRDGMADVIALGRGGIIEPGAYDNAYLMAFNAEYDDDVTECDYSDYGIEVVKSTLLPAKVFMQFNASQFEPLD